MCSKSRRCAQQFLHCGWLTTPAADKRSSTDLLLGPRCFPSETLFGSTSPSLHIFGPSTAAPTPSCTTLCTSSRWQDSPGPGMDILRIYRIERQDLAFESNRASVDSNRIERSSCRFASNRTWQNCWPFDSSRIERESSIFASNRTRKISCLFDSTRIERVSCRFDVYRMPSFDRIRIVFDRT